MNISNPVASEVTSVDFTFLSTEDIQNLSVKQIINPLTFGSVAAGNVPVPIVGGLYDPALGASDQLRQRYVGMTCNCPWIFEGVLQSAELTSRSM